jgi:hypothetical protein
MTATYTENVVEGEYRRPVKGADVYLLNEDGSLAVTVGLNPTTTDTYGFFTFEAADGVYLRDVRVAGVSYARDSIIIGSPEQFTGNPGGNAESVGAFAVARTLVLDPDGGVDQVRVVDRAKATFDKTTAPLDAAGNGLDQFQTPDGKRWTYPPLAAVSAQGLGAGVSGDANDKLALSRALALSRDTAQPVVGTDRVIRQRGVVLETDVYQAGAIQHSVYTAANPTGASFLHLVAAPGAMPTVMIPDGQYLFEIAGRYLGGHVKGIRFVGGKGAFKFTNVDNNVNLPMTFEDCVFLDYTECAIGNMSEDAPYLRLKNCTFIGTATSIGVAWGGYIDGGVFEDNQFIRNRYHLKLGGRLSGNFHVLRNDFIKDARDEIPSSAFYRAADIWIVPHASADGLFGASSGQGAVIASNKFGNEGLGLNETRILIADEDTTTGVDRLSRQHSTVPSTGYVCGLAIRDNHLATRFIVGDGNDAPFLTTYCANTRSFRWSGNICSGGRYQRLAFFYGIPPAQDAYVSQDWLIELDPTSAFQFGVCNIPVGIITDPAGTMQGDRYTLPSYAFADDGLPLKYNGVTSATVMTAGGATTATGPVDQYGGTSMLTATFPTAGAVLFGSLVAGYAGFPHWIEVQLDSVVDETRRMREVIVDIYNPTTQARAFSRTIQVGSGSAGPMRFVMPQDTADTWQWRIRPVGAISGSANQIVAGRVFVSTGDGPTNSRHLLTAGSRWNEPHIVTGPYQLWFDAANRFRRKGGVPTGDTDGDAFAFMAAAQTDSTATTIAALKDDFNALLAKLRVSGGIAS